MGALVKLMADKKPPKITEDDPRWNPKTMGNKRGTTPAQRRQQTAAQRRRQRKRLTIQKGLARPKQNPYHFDQV